MTRVGRPGFTWRDLAWPSVGIACTIVASYAAVSLGLKIGLVAPLVAFIFVGSLVAYLTVPHLAVAATVSLFAVIPALKVFINSNIGGVKDVIDLAAITAGVIFVVAQRHRADKWVIGSMLLLLVIYVINPGHPHDTAWAQGVRLTGEPLLLLFAGLVLPDPKRNLRYALISLIATGCFVAICGVLQQVVSQNTLVSLGYSYSDQLRTIGSHLRSFGTLDDPFDYSAFLLFSLAAVVFWLRRGPLAWSAGALILLGLGASYVRTVVLVLIAYLGIQLLRWRQLVPAAFMVTAALVASSVTLAKSSGTQTNTYTFYTANGGSQSVQEPQTVQGGSVLLNGRISAWTAALGSSPGGWLFGRGVGKVGTAAARATYTFSSAVNPAAQSQAVDSGYLATMADVGLVGMFIELVMFGRLLVLAARSARAGSEFGWIALALIANLMLNALTRAALTGFPTGFLGLFLIGIAVAAATDATAAPQAYRIATLRPGTRT